MLSGRLQPTRMKRQGILYLATDWRPRRQPFRAGRHLWLARFGEVEYQGREASAAGSGRLPGSGAQP